MNKYLKFTLKGVGYFLLLLVVLYVAAYVYVSANKKSIIAKLTTEAGKRLQGKVLIEDVSISVLKSFPEMSIVLKSVSVRDTLFMYHKHPFLEAEEVYVKLGFCNLIRSKSAVTGLIMRNGGLYLFTDTSGYTNGYLLNPKKNSPEKVRDPSNNELSDVSLENVQVTINDLTKNKILDFTVQFLKADISENGAFLNLGVNSRIFVKRLGFNIVKGSFLKEKLFEGSFRLRFSTALKQLQFDSIDVTIAKQPFNITGRFDLAAINSKEPQFKLLVHTNNIDYNFAKSLLTEKISKGVSIVSLSNKLNISALLTGKLKNDEPLIYTRWSTTNTNIKSPLIDIDSASFTGNYTNEVIPGLPRKDPNSKIELYNLKGKWQGLPVTCDKVVINNLYSPTLVCDVKSAFPLSTLGEMLNSSVVSFRAGDAMVDVNYNGPLKKNTTNNSFVNGVISVKNGLVNYNPYDIAMKNVNGRIVFRNSDVLVENLQCQVLNNSIIMQGSAKNVLTLVNTQVNKVVVDWNIYSPSLNLGSFTALLKQKKQVVVKKGIGNKIESAARKLDDVLERGSIDVSMKADKLTFKKFQATNVSAYINMLQNSWLLQNVSLNHAGGQMDIKGSLEDKGVNLHDLKTKIFLKDVDVSQVFTAFDNFGQDGITSQSLKGKLTSDVNLSVVLDDNGNVYPSSIDGLVKFSLKNGALIDYEPVKKLQIFLFKNRDFENIQFAELKNTLEIKNQEVKINRMEIQSNVLSMFVEGVYSMKKTTDISIQIPLSNLKKRDANYKPENEGAGKKGGTSVYIRGTPGSDGNIKFRYDLFHKFRKEK